MICNAFSYCFYLERGGSHKMSSSKAPVGGSSSLLSMSWTQNRCKRIRTIFTTEQLQRLEEQFERQQYMVGTER